MSTTAIVIPQTLFALSHCAQRWNVSKDMLRRKADAGELKTVYIAGRRMVPVSEVERVEREGLGSGRKRGWKRVERRETR